MAVISALICTLNDRVQNVPRILLPERENLHYVVSFQYTDAMFLDMVPDVLRQRHDVTLLLFPDVGLCANRNNALNNCLTPLAVISDDDTPYSEELYEEIIRTFDGGDTADIIVFGDQRLAFRLSPKLPQFDTRFGLGSAFLSCGEEEVLIHYARAFGMKVVEKQYDCYRADRMAWEALESDIRTRRSWGALQYIKHSTPVAFASIVRKALAFDGHLSLRQRWQMFRDMFDGLRYIITHPLNDSVAEEIPLEFLPIDIWKMP